MTPIVIITEEGEIYELTVTEKAKINAPSSITQHKMESGLVVTDNIINGNKAIVLQGIISTILRFDFEGTTNNQKTVEDYIEGLYKLRDSKTFFSLRYDDRLPTLTNCLFKDISIDNDARVGRSYRVMLVIEQVRIAAGATSSIVEFSNPDVNEGGRTGSNTSTEKVEDLNQSFLTDVFTNIFGD